MVPILLELVELRSLRGKIFLTLFPKLTTELDGFIDGFEDSGPAYAKNVRILVNAMLEAGQIRARDGIAISRAILRKCGEVVCLETFGALRAVLWYLQRWRNCWDRV